jgi:hypothetical protein
MSCSVSSTAMNHTWIANLDHGSVFGKVKSLGDKVGSAGYAPAYLQVIFAFGGFNQANYVCESLASHMMLADSAPGTRRDV